MFQNFQKKSKINIYTEYKKRLSIFSLKKLDNLLDGKIQKLPYSIRVLIINLLRNIGNYNISENDLINTINWKAKSYIRKDIPYMPNRIIMQDFTGIPAVVDLAAMRDVLYKYGGNPKDINPIINTTLVIDHSIQVDYYNTSKALEKNINLEFKRNHERYSLLKWGQKNLNNFKVVPPGMGIIHQINLEYLTKIIEIKKINSEFFAYPDTLIGTDSHTTMINSLGVIGWGVGGIEAEAAMLGQPCYINLPDVIGVKILGKAKENITSADLALNITEILRKYNVVGKFIEFFGNDLSHISLSDRATISNMAPEYGATIAFFPVDIETINFLIESNRGKYIKIIKKVLQESLLFRLNDIYHPEYSDIIEIDISKINASISGPKRPQDRISIKKLKNSFKKSLIALKDENGFEINKNDLDKNVFVPEINDFIAHGTIVIAAITSCTNTSNPYSMIGAGLIAKNAVKRGLKIKSFIKTSLAPGSKVVTEYLESSGLLKYMNILGFNIVGYGCTTCIGNSGPLFKPIIDVSIKNNLVLCSVLSGNRNFEGRINLYVKANYLTSPLYVIAYAIAGTINIDLNLDPLGRDMQGKMVYLKDIFPKEIEIKKIIKKFINSNIFKNQYDKIFSGTENWKSLKYPKGDRYIWNKKSSYIRSPNFFSMSLNKTSQDIINARVLLLLGDSVTTDHISPAGAIPSQYPSGRYLKNLNIPENEFNSYGSRRGNHEVMVRGTFSNIRLQNLLIPKIEGGFTKHYPSEKIMYVFDAAMSYKKDNIPLIIISGKEYGVGSSRDWAAKGTSLLGIRAIIAESYERIHRNNLVGMGILPLQFMKGEGRKYLDLNGSEIFNIYGLSSIFPLKKIQIQYYYAHKKKKIYSFYAFIRLDTNIEIQYFYSGGILPYILKNNLKKNQN